VALSLCHKLIQCRLQVEVVAEDAVNQAMQRHATNPHSSTHSNGDDFHLAKSLAVCKTILPAEYKGLGEMQHQSGVIGEVAVSEESRQHMSKLCARAVRVAYDMIQAATTVRVVALSSSSVP
jgi:hypothetical protein